MPSQFNKCGVLWNDVLKLIKYKGAELSRIGHAIHHIVTDDSQIQELQSKIFTSKNVIVITDTIFEIPFNNKIGVQKTISTPIDMLINKKVLLLNIDFFTIGLWTKLFPRAPNFIQKNSVSKLHYRILGSI